MNAVQSDIPGISSSEFAKFRQLIHDIAGIQLSDAKQSLLVGRLGKRLRHLQLNSFSDYFHYLQERRNGAELELMVDLMTTNETYFFREENHFQYLRELIAAHPEHHPLNIWSAASSTGEEVYTLCMVLADELGIDGQWSVTGSDLSRSVLRRAEAGQYDLERVRGLPKHYLHKYCLKGIREQEGTFIIDRALRQHTRFLQVNLKSPLPTLGPFDIIFLRNVMIYFDAPTKQHVVAQLATRLQPGGYLFIGHSETLNGLHTGLQSVMPTIYRKPL